MIAAHHYRDQKVAVFGLGRSGLACARALAAGGAQVVAWDDSADRRAAVPLPLEDPAATDWTKVAALVLSPGVALDHPVAVKARKAGVAVIGDIEIFARALGGDTPVVAITGTNGKSTTTALLAHIIEEAGGRAVAAGNIGAPVLALEPLAAGGVYVLELSSYQIERTFSLHADIAILLNITPDHLDRHGDMAGYVAAKRHLFDLQRGDQIALISADDPHCAGVARTARARLVEFSIDHAVSGGIFVAGGVLMDALDGAPVAVGDLGDCPGLPGRHNGQNAAAAYGAARLLGLEREAIMAGLRSFPGLAHRLESVAAIGGVRFVNDSKATNAEAAAIALASFETIYWIAGGRPKQGGIINLTPHFGKIRHAYLIGEAADDFARTLEGHAPVTRCASLAEAVRAAACDAAAEGRPGAVVLLSPACASFDQFASFEERGEAFRAAVEALA
jgi:UDP-N-acetylmuramoylalanine--D-glutamate ligase